MRGIVALFAVACVGPGIYYCQDHADCGAQGLCEDTGFCSFPDSSCGRRYGEHAAPELRNRCVEGTPPPDGSFPDGGVPDGPVGGCLASCPGTCEGEICLISCGFLDPCLAPVVCPPGLECEILCGDGACSGGVDCTEAASCDVACTGGSSCSGPVVCDGASCSVFCSGIQSCGNVIDCYAEECVVTCLGDQSCVDEIACGPGRCDVRCNNPQSCFGGIDCSDACACTTSCSFGCGIVDCPIGCEDGAGDCTTLPPGCNDC